jgi:hypothetical protein
MVPVAVHRDHDPARRRHPCHFRHRGAGVIDVFQHVLAPDPVEGAIGKGQGREVAAAIVDRVLECGGPGAAARALDEFGVDVDCADMAAGKHALRQRDGGVARTGADVEHLEPGAQFQRFQQTFHRGMELQQIVVGNVAFGFDLDPMRFVIRLRHRFDLNLFSLSSPF